MNLVDVIENIPIYGLFIIGILLLALFVIAYRSGREISLWPPKMGPSIEISNLRDQIAVLESRIAQQQERRESSEAISTQRIETLEKELDETKVQLNDVLLENERLQKSLSEQERKTASAVEDWRSVNDPAFRRIESLFQRDAIEMPIYSGNLLLILKSLQELRIEIQKNVTDIQNNYLRSFYKAVINDLRMMEGMVRLFVRSDLTNASAIFNVPQAEEVMKKIETDEASKVYDDPILNYGAGHGMELKLEETRQYIHAMIGKGWGSKDEKRFTRSQLGSALTFAWLLGSIDTARANMVSQRNLLLFF